MKAVVVLRNGSSVSEAEIIDFCGDQVGGFERPSSVDFVEALPRNASGKVLKRELREPYWKGHGRRRTLEVRPILFPHEAPASAGLRRGPRSRRRRFRGRRRVVPARRASTPS